MAKVSWIWIPVAFVLAVGGCYLYASWRAGKLNDDIDKLKQSNIDLQGDATALARQVAAGELAVAKLTGDNTRLAGELAASKDYSSQLAKQLGASSGYAGAISGNDSTAQGLVDAVASDIGRALAEAGSSGQSHN